MNGEKIKSLSMLQAVNQGYKASVVAFKWAPVSTMLLQFHNVTTGGQSSMYY